MHRRSELICTEYCRLDLSADRQPDPHRRYLLYVFFRAEGSARTGSSNLKLHRPSGGRYRLCPHPRREHDNHAADQRYIDTRIYPVERKEFDRLSDIQSARSAISSGDWAMRTSSQSWMPWSWSATNFPIRFFMLEPETRKRRYGNRPIDPSLGFCRGKGYKDPVFLVQ